MSAARTHDWDTLTTEERAYAIREMKEVRRLAERYGITMQAATKLRLGILAGKVPPPEVAEAEDPDWTKENTP